MDPFHWGTHQEDFYKKIEEFLKFIFKDEDNESTKCTRNPTKEDKDELLELVIKAIRCVKRDEREEYAVKLINCIEDTFLPKSEGEECYSKPQDAPQDCYPKECCSTPAMEREEDLSYGQKLVGLTFNPAGREDVYKIKRLYA